MTNPLLLDIALFLKNSGLASGDGVDVFRDYEPEAPDNIIILREYQGDPATPYEPLVNRSVQIAVRHKNSDTARSKAKSIYNALRSENLIVAFTEDRWGQVYLRQTPFLLYRDESLRAVYGFNVGITTTID